MEQSEAFNCRFKNGWRKESNGLQPFMHSHSGRVFGKSIVLCMTTKSWAIPSSCCPLTVSPIKRGCPSRDEPLLSSVIDPCKVFLNRLRNSSACLKSCDGFGKIVKWSRWRHVLTNALRVNKYFVIFRNAWFSNRPLHNSDDKSFYVYFISSQLHHCDEDDWAGEVQNDQCLHISNAPQ